MIKLLLSIFLILIISNILKIIKDPTISKVNAWLQYIKKIRIILVIKWKGLISLTLFLELKFKNKKRIVNKKVRIYDLSSWEYLMWYKFIVKIKKPKTTDFLFVILIKSNANKFKEIILIINEKYLDT